jgi:hypothetical protein
MAHSAIVGGSTADRVLNCPASYQATRALPPSADVSSEYAEEGTAMHEVMTRLMNIRHVSGLAGKHFDGFKEARTLLGLRFHDRALTQEHLDTMIEPALVHLAALEDIYSLADTPFEVLGVEQRFAFPGIPGAFGTCDLILGNTDFVVHVDWKFGQGVGVKAVYRDEEGDMVNPQLLFYAAGASATIKGLYRSFGSGYRRRQRKPVLAIIQPRGEEPLSHVAISRREISWFVEDLQSAVVEALDRNPRMAKGEHCRFAPCKVNCPLWINAVLDLSALPGMPKAETKLAPTVTPYGEYLARAKALVDILAMFKKEVDEQLHSYLESGGLVPGWRLKAKAKQRQWIDESIVATQLHMLGFEPGEIFRRQLVTFASADATARRLGVKIPDDLRIAPETTETTVAATDDPAPVIDRRGAAEAFQTALKALGAPAK